MTLPLALVLQLATVCAPTVAPETIAAIARTESRFDPLAIGDNTAGRSYSPASVDEAIELATRLRSEGHSIDLGLMQVNSSNLTGLSLSIADTFDACRSVAAGGRILSAAFAGGATVAEAQGALRVALSRYNTGNAQRGFLNGYVQRVEAAARQIVPALDGTVMTALPQAVSSGRATPHPALPSAMPVPVPAASDGEWHAVGGAAPLSEESEGEWHAAGSMADPAAAANHPSAPAGPASVVILQGRPGSKS